MPQGPITCFARGPHTELEAAVDFPPGAEVTMSYGRRSSDRTLQFQGYASPEPGDVATDETALALVLPDVVGSRDDEADEGASPARPPPSPAAVVAADALWPIRVNLLRSLTIAPEHNGQRHLQLPAAPLLAAIRAAQRSAAGSPDGAPSREAQAALERARWSVPFTFSLRGADGRLSHEAESFARVGAIRDKAEAAAALKAAAAARGAVAVAYEAHKAARAAARSARGGREDGEEEDDDDDDEFELPAMVLPPLSAANEGRAQRALAGALVRAIAAIEAAPGGGGGGGGDDDAPALPPGSPVLGYRALQLSYYRAALARVQGKLRALREGGAPALAGGAGGAPQQLS